MRVDSHTQIRQAMRVDSHTQIRQAMRVFIHAHISCRLLVEGSAPKPPLLNTEFHSVAARSTNAFKGRNKSFHPIVFGLTVKQSGPWKLGRQNATPFFPSRDRCERRALLDYFKRGGFHHHVGQPDTPPGVLGFVLVLHLMFFQ